MGDRHQFRALWCSYDAGLFFVTICSHEKKQIFGQITDSRFQPSYLGSIIEEYLSKLTSYYNDVEIWNSVIMPNHLHLILNIGSDTLDSNVGTRFIASAESKGNLNPVSAPGQNVGTRFFASATTNSASNHNLGCLKPPMHDEPIDDYHHNSYLARIIGAFKAGVTRTARTRKIASLPCWQSRFHEHIIRNQQSLNLISDYIDNNVANWSKDCFYS